MPQGTVLGHNITNTDVNGLIGSNDFTADGVMNFHDGRIELATSLREMATTPSYEYQLKAEELDLGTLLEGENFSTSLNGFISGKGTGFDPESMQLRSTVEVDSSIIDRKSVV